jgi:hypothetical protein
VLWKYIEELLQKFLGSYMPSKLSMLFTMAIICTVLWGVASIASRVLKVVVIIVWIFFMMLFGLTLLKIV